MIRTIALDDEPPALRVIAHFCSQVDFIDLQKTFSSTSDALNHLQQFPVDLIFLDIHMPSMSGIEFYKAIPQQAMVIFTTAYAEYAVEGFNLNAVDYLLKPFTFERFAQAVNKANDYHKFLYQNEETKQAYLFIRADYSLYKIALADILFIEGLDDYLKIHIQDSKTVVARMTMKALLQKLPETEFIRVHRSYIVPFSRIENVRNKVISLAGEEIPVGSSYEADFFKRFQA
jgi:DNA-binding LytR/AlgR family response regulator